jgi:hypothetical protein
MHKNEGNIKSVLGDAIGYTLVLTFVVPIIPLLLISVLSRH